MKTKIVLLIILAIIISSCLSQGYLPYSDKIDINQYGSQINISRVSGPNVIGELIAVDSSKMIVLTDYNRINRIEKSIVIITFDEIRRFKLQYAKSRSYWWTIPIYTLATISHGWWLIISAPINLLVTASVTSSGVIDFQYHNKDITHEELKMFARFPQGIPSNIDIASIK